ELNHEHTQPRGTLFLRSHIQGLHMNHLSTSHSAEASTQASTIDLSDTLRFTRNGEIGVLTLHRPANRNALDDQTISGVGEFFAHPPVGISVIVLNSTGEHFCAGLDLSEMTHGDAVAGLHLARREHTTMNPIA